MWSKLLSPKVLSVVWLLTIIATAGMAWQYRAAICEATVSDIHLAATREALKQAEAAAETARRYEETIASLRQTTTEIVREVEKVVERPVYRDCRLDPDGVRVLRQARGLAGEPDSDVPPATYSP